MSLKGINAYKKGSVKQEVSTADPHRLTLLLMQGALDRVAYAKGAIERKDFESKAEFISKVSAILLYLRDTLDLEAGGEIASNLYGLYDYMLERINVAHINHAIEPLDEVYSLLEPIRTAWLQVPESEKERAYAQRAG